MASNEDYLDALTAYARNPIKEIPPILEHYLKGVAKNGETLFQWHLLKPLIISKMEQVIGQLQQKWSSEIIPERPNVENVRFDVLRARIMDALNKFNGAPFTIQRLCELLIDPRRHYKRSDKLMRGLEKNVLVVTTVDPFGRKVVTDTGSKSLINGLDGSGTPFFPRDSNISLPPVPGWVTTTRPPSAPSLDSAEKKSTGQQDQLTSKDSPVLPLETESADLTSSFCVNPVEQASTLQSEEVIEETVVTMDTNETGTVATDGGEAMAEDEVDELDAGNDQDEAESTATNGSKSETVVDSTEQKTYSNILPKERKPDLDHTDKQTDSPAPLKQGGFSSPLRDENPADSPSSSSVHHCEEENSTNEEASSCGRLSPGSLEDTMSAGELDNSFIDHEDSLENDSCDSTTSLTSEASPSPSQEQRLHEPSVASPHKGIDELALASSVVMAKAEEAQSSVLSQHESVVDQLLDSPTDKCHSASFSVDTHNSISEESEASSPSSSPLTASLDCNKTESEQPAQSCDTSLCHLECPVPSPKTVSSEAEVSTSSCTSTSDAVLDHESLNAASEIANDLIVSEESGRNPELMKNEKSLVTSGDEGNHDMNDISTEVSSFFTTDTGRQQDVEMDSA